LHIYAVSGLGILLKSCLFLGKLHSELALKTSLQTILIFSFFRVGTLAGFGGAAGLAVLYFTDWKAVLQYMPIYNTKFPQEKKE
jgi:ubiquinol-cytochrome c reductase subunit 10